MGTHGHHGSNRATRLPYDATAPPAARRIVGDLMTDLGSSAEHVADACLVAHELVVNGLEHGSPDEDGRIELTCCLDHGELVISVRDQGTSGQVRAKPPTPHEVSGRGLAMVEALSSHWTVDRSLGTRVAAWLPI